MSKARYFLKPPNLAVCLWLTMACANGVSQTNPPPDAVPPTAQGDHQDKSVPAAEGAPAAPPDLPDKLPGEALPGENLLPEPLPAGSARVTKSKQKKAEEEAAAEEADSRTDTPTDNVAEVARRGSVMNQALGTGDTILGGFSSLQGGVSSPFLPEDAARAEPFQFGWGRVRMRVGAGVSASRVSGTATGGTDESVTGFVQGGIAVSTGNRAVGFSSSAYRTKPGSHMFATLSYDVGYGFPDSGGDGTSFGSGQASGLEHRFSLSGNFFLPNLPRLIFGVGLNFSSVSGINRDFGAETDRYFATASLTAQYELSRKTSIDLELAMPFRDFTDGISSSGVITTISGRTWITPKLRLGVGYTLGKLSVQESSDESYQQGLLLANYQPTRFLSFSGTAGIEFRNTGDSTISTPVFGVSASWNPTRGSTASLAAQRRIFNSASAADTDFTSTSFIVSFGQQLWDRLSASLSVGYEMAVYKSRNGNRADGREDNLLSFGVGLSYPITDHLGCSLNYSFAKNDSDISPFTSSRANFQVNYAF